MAYLDYIELDPEHILSIWLKRDAIRIISLSAVANIIRDVLPTRPSHLELRIVLHEVEEHGTLASLWPKDTLSHWSYIDHAVADATDGADVQLVFAVLCYFNDRFQVPSPEPWMANVGRNVEETLRLFLPRCQEKGILAIRVPGLVNDENHESHPGETDNSNVILPWAGRDGDEKKRADRQC